MTLFKYCMKQCIKYILVLLVILFFLIAPSIVSVNAESSMFSDVMDDLSRDLTFNVDEYPSITNSADIKYEDIMQVIQVAENSNKELFIYIYQPYGNTESLKALKINMALTEISLYDENIFNVYDLQHINTNGVFSKYVVKGLDIPSGVNVFNITSLYREYSSTFDGGVSDDDVIVGKKVPVAKIYEIGYFNDEYISKCHETLYVDIDITNFGFLRYRHNLMVDDYIDAHYVAFNVVNFDIQHIYNAELRYDLYYYEASKSGGASGSKKYCLPNEALNYKEQFLESRKVTLYDDETTSVSQWWSGRKFEWSRIETRDKFLSRTEGELYAETETTLGDFDYVFNFAETTVNCENEGTFIWSKAYLTKNVAVLRIKFLSEDKVYNLGVVSDMGHSDGNPDAVIGDIDTELIGEWFEKILMLIGFLILCVILGFLSPVFSVIFNVLIKCLGWAFKGALMIISLPFKFIGSLFKTKNKR